jgi:arylsulfatase
MKASIWRVVATGAVGMDPYERALEEGGGQTDFFARQMWLLVPIGGKIKDLFADFDKYPFQEGSSLNSAGINYGMLRMQDAMKRLKDVEALAPPRD